MITPRQTRLVRTRGLRAFQAAIAAAARDGAERRAVIVPSRAAADELRRTIARRLGRLAEDTAGARPLPDLVSRDDWYVGMHRRLAAVPPLASPFERDVLAGRASREAAAAAPPPFPLRPGLVVEMLALYDELRRRLKTVEQFERLLVGSLEPSADVDRGAARLLEATRFLAAAFRAYERLIGGSGRLDEHALRARLLESPAPAPLDRVIVTVPDQDADRTGLWPADFDLLARMPGLSRVDVVATEEMLASGFLERLHTDLLPGLVEERWGDEEAAPVLVAPPAPPGQRHWRLRDREEELAEAVRRLPASTASSHEAGAAAGDGLAIVFQRPLPYVYLARQVFGAARLPYQAFDALPLAAEPYAATLDLVLSAVASDFTRADTVALLRSPHLNLSADGAPLTAAETAALDRVLRIERHLGGADAIAALAERVERGTGVAPSRDARTAQRALRAALSTARELAALQEEARPSEHLERLAAFLDRHDRPIDVDDAIEGRHARARAAIRDAIDARARAHREHDDPSGPFEDVAAALGRWIEAQTFTPRAGVSGPHLLDAAAARYGDFEDVRLVGLVDLDWPEPAARTIFFPASLLVQLGWPAEPGRLAGARAAFRDLLRLPASRLALSVFTLEDDALVRPSALLEEVEGAGLAVVHLEGAEGRRVFAHEALMDEPADLSAAGPEAAAWMAVRTARAPAADPRFHGITRPRPPGPLRISAVEQYLDCPFRYFAARVLRLGEEREEEPGLTALERGLLVHQVFEQFFDEWQREGRGAITVDNVADARSLFARVAEVRVAMLPEADRALERARLLGSAVASGLGSAAFEFEIEADTAVVERLLEHPLEGEFVFDAGDGPRPMALRGKADRIDLLADGTIRVIDYKLGRRPKRARKIQLPVYGACAEQRLQGHLGRAWRLGGGGYLAFAERQAFVPLERAGQTVEEAIREGVARLLDAASGIARGEFPVRPDQPFFCTYCPYPSVCRKDAVGDE